MAFFSDNFETNLVASEIRDKVIKIDNQIEISGYTISERIANLLNMIYSDYIQRNKLLAFLIVAIFVFLVYRYCKKLDNEGYTNSKKLIDEIKNQTKCLKHNTQPSFNPLFSVSKQAKPVNYIPEPIYINTGNADGKMVDGRKLYPYAKPYEPLNEPDDDYNDVHKYKRRDYYTGTDNSYLQAQDTLIPHPYDWPENINTSTGNFVGFMTNANNNSLVNYQNIVNNNEQNSLMNVRDGPQYLNIGNPELDMDPPYATEIL